MSADLVRQLSALGLNLDQVAGVMDIMDADAANRREKGRERWHKWKDKKATNVSQQTANVSSQLTRGEDSSSKEEIIEKKESKKDATSAQADLAAFKSEFSELDTERLEALVKHRRAKRAALTGHAALLFRNDATAAGLSIPEAVDTCISRNWITVKADWLKRPQSTASPGNGKMNAVQANLARRNQKNESASGRRDYGDVELLPPDQPGLPSFIGDLRQALTIR